MIHVACIKGHLDIVRFMLKNNYFDKEERNEYGYTTLDCASIGGHLEIVKYLINIGCNKETRNNVE
jgi:ankyrin repeat protein